VIGGALILLTMSVPAGTAAGPVFESGDLIISEGNLWTGGDITWHRGDGSIVTALDPGFEDVSGADFDPAGRLWVVSFLGNKAVALDNSGALLGTIVDEIQAGPNAESPTDISFDATGNAYIGSFGGGVTKFDPTGAPFGFVADSSGADSVDVAADQCTLFWQAENDESIYQRDICLDGPVERRILGLGEPRGMRILPDGSFIDVEPGAGVVLRLSAEPSCDPVLCDDDIVQIYDAPDCDKWARVTLNEDGTTFWSSCFEGATSTNPGTPVPYDLLLD
jgi:hypothetical protein